VLALLSQRALKTSGLDAALNSLTSTLMHKVTPADSEFSDETGLRFYEELLKVFVLITNYIATVEQGVKK
jgi:hypothetical protein